MSRNSKQFLRNRLATALVIAIAAPSAFAQDANAPTNTETKELDKVVVTGSLIPQTTLETAKPVVTISAQDLKSRGYQTVQDAIHQSSFATGGVQGNSGGATFTKGAETTSFFGLNPGYTKYLIDGRPMANYPALYNGSDVFNNISGIPVDLVERIEILPGGQSSLYGSDAIAGVVNIILKKRLAAPVITARLGGYQDGGGESRRVSFASSAGSEDGRFNLLFGAQFEKDDPMWASQRDLTKQFNLNGSSPPVASRDWLVIGARQSYLFLDPSNCANVSSAFGGTVGLQTRPGRANPYCGSFYTPGYQTIKNGKESAQVYLHGTFDINDKTQLYGDLLYSNESVRFHNGSGYLWWGSSNEFSATNGYFWDPNLNDRIQIQHAFAPEEMNGWNRSMSRNDDRSYAATFGVNGTIGDSTWDYDVGVTRTEYHLTEHPFIRLKDPINAYFNSRVLGPQQGTHTYRNVDYPVFTPNYAAFYTLIPASDFDSFTDHATTRSMTSDTVFRAQATNSALFSLPGGDAGLAVAIEGGSQTWHYNPDPRLIADPVTLESQVWGTQSVSGNGNRTRGAVTGELRLPIWTPLTVSLSGRYDRYKAAGRTLSKPTYNLGLEYRPVESLLLRGQYGTAFKAPTLADQFQGASGFYSSTNDYLYCHRLAGYTPSDFSACLDDPNADVNVAQPQYLGTNQGNPDLRPINAKNFSYGVVWAPTAKFSIGADFHHWNIRDEVAGQSVDQLMRDELNCTPVAQGGTGGLDPNSGTCRTVFGQITRDADGVLQSLRLTKVNVSREILNVVTLNSNYRQSIGNWGELNFAGSWTRNLKHELQQYPGDEAINLLDNGYYSRDPNYRANASVGWSRGPVAATLYADYIGPSGNYIAWTEIDGFNAEGGRRIGSYTTLNLSASYDVSDSFRLTGGVTNIGNRMPTGDTYSYTGLDSAPYNEDLFNVYGRGYFLEARWDFGKGK